jgi:hypothetical protein
MPECFVAKAADLQDGERRGGNAARLFGLDSKPVQRIP